MKHKCILCLVSVPLVEFLQNDHVCSECGVAMTEDFRDWTIRPYNGLLERLAQRGQSV